MILPGDFHIHSNFSDGRNTAEELVQKALALGFTALGFAEHSQTGDPDYMDEAREAAYETELARLKEKYQGKLDLLWGIEQDYFSLLPAKKGYDYIIGSVHTVKHNGKVIDVDYSLERTKRDLADNYTDVYDFVEDYFAHVANLPQVTPMDIIGHLDLLTKWQEREPLFDEAHPRYRAAAEEAVKALMPLGIPFEINCGAMARGYRTAPYPAKPLLRSIYELGGDIVINGDCHNADHLGHGFDTALKLAKECGFGRVVALSSSGKQYVNL